MSFNEFFMYYILLMIHSVVWWFDCCKKSFQKSISESGSLYKFEGRSLNFGHCVKRII